MIGLITGELLAKQPPLIIVEAAGVGYEIEVPMTTLYELPEKGATVRLFTHFVVREDAQLLFGFHNQLSRDLFRTLIKINGVGPKMAVAMMSTLTVDDMVRAVQENSVGLLVKVPGVGKKTAERLLVELQDKIDGFASSDAAVSGLFAASGGSQVADQLIDEAQSALVALGYKKNDAVKLVDSAWKAGEYTNSQSLIKASLRQLAK